MPLLSILTVVFVIAKIMGYISWSWWLVLSPAIFGLVVFLIIFFGAFALYVNK